MTAAETSERKRAWYQRRRAACADETEHKQLLRNAKPAADGLPDDLRAALLSIGQEGEYEAWASEPLVECSRRGLIEIMEECGDERRAILTGWGNAVREILASTNSPNVSGLSHTGGDRG